MNTEEEARKVFGFLKSEKEGSFCVHCISEAIGVDWEQTQSCLDTLVAVDKVERIGADMLIRPSCWRCVRNNKTYKYKWTFFEALNPLSHVSKPRT